MQLSFSSLFSRLQGGVNQPQRGSSQHTPRETGGGSENTETLCLHFPGQGDSHTGGFSSAQFQILIRGEKLVLIFPHVCCEVVTRAAGFWTGLRGDRARTEQKLFSWPLTKILGTKRASAAALALSFMCPVPLELCPSLWLFIFCLAQTERRGDADVGGGVDNRASSPMSSPPSPTDSPPLTPHCTYLLRLSSILSWIINPITQISCQNYSPIFWRSN